MWEEKHPIPVYIQPEKPLLESRWPSPPPCRGTKRRDGETKVLGANKHGKKLPYEGLDGAYNGRKDEPPHPDASGKETL